MRERSLAYVTEVMVNGPDDVFVEREGRIERAERPL
jgi:Flp pilus assembly CpaF family ATPase